MDVVTDAVCAGICVLCVVLLLRGYAETRSRLLAWSAVCFVGLGLNNVLSLVDAELADVADWLRFATALAGLSALLFALIWEGDR